MRHPLQATLNADRVRCRNAHVCSILHTPEYDGLSDAENWIVDVISVYTSEHEENYFDWRLMSAMAMLQQLLGFHPRSGF